MTAEQSVLDISKGGTGKRVSVMVMVIAVPHYTYDLRMSRLRVLRP